MNLNAVRHGTVFRVQGKWPYETCVDFMLVFVPDMSDGRHFGLLVTTGHKAGNLLVRLPTEAHCEGGLGVKKDWLKENWSHWIYPECDFENVILIKRYFSSNCFSLKKRHEKNLQKRGVRLGKKACGF